MKEKKKCEINEEMLNKVTGGWNGDTEMARIIWRATADGYCEVCNSNIPLDKAFAYDEETAKKIREHFINVHGVSLGTID